MLQCKSPVQFPPQWQRTSVAAINPQFGQNVGIEQAIKYLEDELNDIAAESAILYSNFDDINNAPRRAKRGHSEGVGLRFSYHGQALFMGCDKWALVAQNIYGLHLSLRYMRSIADAGVVELGVLLRAFALSDTSSSSSHTSTQEKSASPEWMRILGLGETATLQDANAVYRVRAKQMQHDEESLIALNQAIEQARHILRD